MLFPSSRCISIQASIWDKTSSIRNGPLYSVIDARSNRPGAHDLDFHALDLSVRLLSRDHGSARSDVAKKAGNLLQH